MKRSGLIYIVAGVVLAVTAGALLFLYLSNLTSQASQTPTPTPIPSVDVVVAGQDLKTGMILTADMIKREPRLVTEVEPDTLRNASEVVDRMVVLEAKAGTVLRRGDLQSVPFVLPKGKKAMAVFVDDQSSVAGLVRERDYVDIVINEKIKIGDAKGTPQASGEQTSSNGKTGSALQPTDEQTTVKAALQRIQVLKVVAPPATGNQQQAAAASPPPAQTTPGPEATATAQAYSEAQTQRGQITNAQAIVILAVTDQEAEVIHYARESGGLQMILRGHDDESKEETKGMTLDILIRDYGLPVPKPVIVDMRPE